MESTRVAMPQTKQQQIRSHLRRYERTLAQAKKKFGDYSDGAGKRYEIGPHYMLLDDNEGAVAAFQWFEREFDDDAGKPDHLLCWSLAVHRAGDEVGAAKKLRQAMLGNLNLVPHLLGRPIPELDALWSEEEKDWASSLSGRPELEAARERFIEILRRLDGLRPGPERNDLVKELSNLRWG
jgi:hypothetical protein